VSSLPDPSFRREVNSNKESRPNIRSFSELPDEVRAIIRKQVWWETALLVVGCITVFAILGAIFVGTGNTPNHIYTDAPVPPVNSPLFLATLSYLINAPVEQGGAVTILNNGDEFIPALLDAIDHAKYAINFSVYIWRDGTFSKQVLDGLLRAQKRGAKVRLLLDGFGSKETPSRKFMELKEAGARVESFRNPQFGKLTRFHRRNHRRSIVIDGNIGFTGGMAVADDWIGHAQDPEHWRDMMFKLTGPAARRLQAAFVSAWAGSTGEILTAPDTYPIASETSASEIEKFIHVVHSPAAEHHSMENFLLMGILAARKTLYVVTPYFIPDKHLQRALVKRAEAGVDVRLLLPGKHIDAQISRRSAQSNYEELLQAGVKIYEYQPTFIHSKYIVVDGQWSIVGSPNLNTRSRQLDEENAFGILDSQFAGQLLKGFMSDLEQAEEIKLDEWRRRNVFVRLMQRASRILDNQS
jgi:cardiolipin synthase A/B